MTFDPANCLWSIAGAAEEFLKTKERTEIAQVLRDCEPASLSPKEIAEQLGKEPGAVRKLLHTMQQDNEVMSVGYGKYKLVERTETKASTQPPKPTVACPLGHTEGSYWHYRNAEWTCSKCHTPMPKEG